MTSSIGRMMRAVFTLAAVGGVLFAVVLAWLAWVAEEHDRGISVHSAVDFDANAGVMRVRSFAVCSRRSCLAISCRVLQINIAEAAKDTDSERIQYRMLCAAYAGDSVTANGMEMFSMGAGGFISQLDGWIAFGHTTNVIPEARYSITVLMLTQSWPVIVVLLLPGAVWAGRAGHRRWMIRRRRKRGLCVQCGYDLRATPHRCPECGLRSHGEAIAGHTRWYNKQPSNSTSSALSRIFY